MLDDLHLLLIILFLVMHQLLEGTFTTSSLRSGDSAMMVKIIFMKIRM